MDAPIGMVLTNHFPASYGSLARFKDVERLYPVGNNTVIGAGGDMSDFQYLQKLLNELMIDEFTQQDGHTLGPAEIHEYLSQVMYARRTKINPLWNSLVVGGFKDGKRCVALVDVRFSVANNAAHLDSWRTLTCSARRIRRLRLQLDTAHISRSPCFGRQLSLTQMS